MLGHTWGTEVPMHRRLAVRLRVAAALLLDYCFAGPRDAAVSATLLLPLLLWLGLLRIPLVRWSLGFVPECLRVGFRWVAALSWWGDIRRSVVLQRKRGGVARYLPEYLVDVSKNKKNSI